MSARAASQKSGILAAGALVATIVVSIVLLEATLLPASLFGTDGDHSNRRAEEFLIAAALPYLAVLGVLMAKPKAGFGPALAIGVAATVLVLGLPYLLLVTMLAGFMTHSYERAGLLSAYGLALVQVALIVSAWQTMRRVSTPRDAWMWPTGVLLPIVYGFSVIGFFNHADATARQSAEQTARQFGTDLINGSRRRMAARGTIESISRCLSAYAAANPQAGYPPSLTPLGPVGSGCLTPAGIAGESDGFGIAYVAGLPHTDGAIHIYSMCARPLQYRPGMETLTIDETGDILSGQPRRIAFPPTDSAPCAQMSSSSMTDGTIRGIRHCVIAYAARYPERGYPERLTDIARSGDPCIVEGFPDNYHHGDSVGDASARYTYLGGLPDGQGRITTFSIYMRSRGFARLTDQSGTVYETTEARLPIITDPTLAELRAKGDAIKNPPPPRDAVLIEQGCAAGDLDDCARAGELALGRAKRRLDEHTSGVADDVAVAVKQFTRLCDIGRSAACARIGDIYADGKLVPISYKRATELYKRACALGNANGCLKLGALARLSGSETGGDILPDRAELVRSSEKVCDGGVAAACEAAGTLLANSRATSRDLRRAASFFERACNGGMPEGCYQLGVMTRDGDPVARNDRLGRYLIRKACVVAELPSCLGVQ